VKGTSLGVNFKNLPQFGRLGYLQCSLSAISKDPKTRLAQLRPSGGFGHGQLMSSRITSGFGVQTTQPQRTAADRGSQPCRIRSIRKDEMQLAVHN
jgi:hypothetical protein